MGKKKGGKPRTPKAPKEKSIDFDSEGEDIYDDVDKFHLEDRRVGEKSIKKQKKRLVEEVLNVEGDASSSEAAEEDGDDSSDFGSDAEKDKGGFLPSKDAWGKRKRDFYKAGYVDNDYAQASSDEEELAMLEEADALERQKALDAAAGKAALRDVWEDDEEEEGKKSGEKAGKGEVVAEQKWTVDNVLEVNEQFSDHHEELTRRRDLFSLVVSPLLSLQEHLPDSSSLKIQLQTIGDVYSSYLLNVGFYLQIKAASFEAKKMRDSEVDNHPVIEQIERLKKMLIKVDLFLEKNSDALMSLLLVAEKDESVTERLPKEAVEEPKWRRKAPPASEETAYGGEGDGEENEEDEGDGKRGVSYAIQKNKQLNAKKKKGPVHARAAKRKQFAKALVRRRSQVPDVRKEEKRYAGEARGIRVSTVKSTKLVA